MYVKETNTMNDFNKASYLREREGNNDNQLINSNKLIDSSKLIDSDELIESWINKAGLDYDQFFERLSLQNMNKQEFLNIMYSKDTPKNSVEMSWIEDLKNILIKEDTTYNLQENSYGGIGYFAQPFVRYFKNQLKNHFTEYKKDTCNLESVIKALGDALFIELKNISSRTVVLNFHELKSKQDVSSNNQFMKTYIDLYLKDYQYIYLLLKENPVLARIMVDITFKAINNSINIIERFFNDYKSIRKNFFNYSNNELILEKINIGLGDNHKGGQSVAILEFTNGEKLVYKPRSLKEDICFSEFTNWLNKEGLKYPIKVINTLDKGSYGWQELIKNKECLNESDINKYYYRIGVYIAIFNLLNSTDMHYENIIASGEHPYIIDLETLFSNTLFGNKVLKYPIDYLKDSVFGSGFIPNGKVFNSHYDFDLSGIGGIPKQKSEKHKGLAIVDEDNDNIRFENVPFITYEKDHLVKFNGNIINPNEYSNAIEEGLKETYCIFLRNKNKLFNIIEKSFNDCECRHILRATTVYFKFLMSSYHPQYLKNGLDRQLLFEMLWNMLRMEPKYKHLVQSEIEDLLDNDIPYYTFKLNSKSIFDSRGNEYTDIFEKEALSLVKEKINDLSLKDLKRHISLVKLSLETNSISGLDVGKVEKINTFQSPNNIFGSQHLIETAEYIGEYFIQNAVPDIEDKFATWLGLVNNQQNNTFDLRELDFNLYSGILGITIFLAQLAQETQEYIYKEYAEKSLNYVLGKFDGAEDYLPNSMFNGLGAITYSTFYLSILWDDKNLFNKAKKFLNKMKNLKKDNQYETDFLGGHAGIITFCLNLYKNTSLEDALEVAKLYGYDLLVEIKKRKNEFENNEALTGLAHGTSGYILALKELGHYLNNEEMNTLSQELIEYEDKLFDSIACNWLDLREQVIEKENSFYWCHGAPGIILSRALVKSIDSTSFEDTDFKRIIDKIISKKEIVERLGLCHGFFGITDICISVSKLDNTLVQKEEIIKLVNKHLNQINVQEKFQGMLERGLLGLMLGVSGIGYTLLRLNNTNIPSVLTLELPKSMVNKF